MSQRTFFPLGHGVFASIKSYRQCVYLYIKRFRVNKAGRIVQASSVGLTQKQFLQLFNIKEKLCQVYDREMSALDNQHQQQQLHHQQQQRQQPLRPSLLQLQQQQNETQQDSWPSQHDVPPQTEEEEPFMHQTLTDSCCDEAVTPSLALCTNNALADLVDPAALSCGYEADSEEEESRPAAITTTLDSDLTFTACTPAAAAAHCVVKCKDTSSRKRKKTKRNLNHD